MVAKLGMVTNLAAEEHEVLARALHHERLRALDLHLDGEGGGLPVSSSSKFSRGAATARVTVTRVGCSIHKFC